MSILLFESLESTLKDQVAMVRAGIDSEKATSIVFDHWPVEDSDKEVN